MRKRHGASDATSNRSRSRCLEFEVAVSPDAVVHSYTDFLGNMVHHFNIPSMHQELNIETRSLVERLNVASPVKSGALIGWEHLDAVAGESAHWDWVHPAILPSRPIACDPWRSNFG